MTKRTGPTNYQLQQLVAEIEPHAKKSDFWRRISNDLQKPTRQRRSVNIYKINQNALDGETVIVPGKVLAVGDMHKKIDVVALAFSSEAKAKITSAKGKVLTITELLQQNPQAKKVRILG